MKKTCELLVIALSSIVMLIASCVCASAYNAGGIASESVHYYKKEIPVLEKQLNQKEAELKNLKATAQSSKGCEYFYFVTILSSNPLIIYNDNYLRGPIGYACIYNASVDFIDSVYGWSGYAKPLGTYTYYNNKSIPNYQAVNIKTNSSEIKKAENDISNLKNKINNYKKALNGVQKSKIFTFGEDNKKLSATTVRIDMDNEDCYYINYYFTKDYYDRSKLKWYSSNTKIATVDERAMVQFKKSGEVTITGAYSQTNSKLTIKFIVTDYLDSISIYGNGTNEGEMNKGETLKLYKNIYPDNSSDKIYWISSNISVATVSNGVVKGISPGVAYIYAYSKGKVVSNPFKVCVTGKNKKVNAADNKKKAILCLTQNNKYNKSNSYANEFYTVDEKEKYYVVNAYSSIENYVAKTYGGINVSCSKNTYYVRKKDGMIFINVDGKREKYDIEDNTDLDIYNDTEGTNKKEYKFSDNDLILSPMIELKWGMKEKEIKKELGNPPDYSTNGVDRQNNQYAYWTYADNVFGGCNATVGLQIDEYGGLYRIEYMISGDHFNDLYYKLKSLYKASDYLKDKETAWSKTGAGYSVALDVQYDSYNDELFTVCTISK